MAAEETVSTTLLAASGVTSIVSTRIYTTPVPESAAKPFVEYRLLSGTPRGTLGGVGDPRREIIRIGCCSKSYKEAAELSDAVISALEGDGHLDGEFHFYDDTTQTHVFSVDWAYQV